MTKGQELPTDLTSEIQRMMVKDMHDFRITKVICYDPVTYESRDFWESRKEYKAFSFPVFLANVENVARNVRSHLRKSEEASAKRAAKESKKKRKEEEKKTKEKGGADEKATDTLEEMMQGLVFEQPTQKLTDTFVEAYPCGDRVLVVVELFGDVKAEEANAFDFSPAGDKIVHWTRTPSVWTDEQKLIGALGSTIADADTIILGNAIKKRLKDSPKPSKDGFLWIPMEIINLPFCCEPMLFDKSGQSIDSYLAQGNEKGFRWGYFWLVREGCNPESAKKLVFTCHDEEEDDNDEASHCLTGNYDADDISEATEACAEEEQMDKDGDESVDESVMMDCEQSTKGSNSPAEEGRSDLSVMRGMWSKEIDLREKAEQKRKAALDAQHMAEDRAKTANEKAKTAKEAARKTKEDAQKAVKEADERATRAAAAEKERFQQAAEEEKQRIQSEARQRFEKEAALEKQRIHEEARQHLEQVAAEEKQRLEEDARRRFEKAAAEEKQRLQEEARQRFEKATAEEKQRLHKEAHLEKEELRTEADQAKERESEQRDEYQSAIAPRRSGQKSRLSIDSYVSVDAERPAKRMRVVDPKATRKSMRRILKAKRSASNEVDQYIEANPAQEQEGNN
ncbi:unnamed protein product [Cylindrotheca closterium]|uniref:Uncharacterized protein n=1 Tax=Cylindrotheca closterium TaxID=2856 RepID=A0AAD2FVA6_9STRA|nr:unnamed protein product [Cylindrotheca closterium]